MRVLGIKIASFNDKESGKLINFCQLHVADQDKNVQGEAVEVLKIKPELIPDVRVLKPGDKITITYNKFGKVESFSKEA